MSLQIINEIISVPAAADYSASQFCGVSCTLAAATLASATGQKITGFLLNKPSAANYPAEVQTRGIVPAKAGAAITAGDELVMDTSGRVITAANNHGWIVGHALEAAGGSGEIISVLIGIRRRVPICFSLDYLLADIADGDLLTNYTPGFAGRIVKVTFAVKAPATTGSKGSTLNLEIGTTNLTGGVVTLTSANCTPKGALVEGTAVSAANTFTASDTISVEASSTTAFAEGSGTLRIVMLDS